MTSKQQSLLNEGELGKTNDKPQEKTVAKEMYAMSQTNDAIFLTNINSYVL